MQVLFILPTNTMSVTNRGIRLPIILSFIATQPCNCFIIYLLMDPQKMKVMHKADKIVAKIQAKMIRKWVKPYWLTSKPSRTKDEFVYIREMEMYQLWVRLWIEHFNSLYLDG